jgi:hypothetical protein
MLASLLDNEGAITLIAEPRVFISHSSADKKAIAPLLEQLISHGLLLWVDRPNAEALGWPPGHPALAYVRGIDLSSNWQDKIKAAINSSAALVAFWSRRSVKSTTVLMEVAAHLFRDSDFHVNMETDGPPPELDGIIMAKQFARADTEGEIAGMIARLIETVRARSATGVSDVPNVDREQVGAYWRLEQYNSARKRGLPVRDMRSSVPAIWIPHRAGHYVSQYAPDMSVDELQSQVMSGQIDPTRLLTIVQCERIFTPGRRRWEGAHPFGFDWGPGHVVLGWDGSRAFSFGNPPLAQAGTIRGAVWLDDLM